jgi:hypothetical protein
MGCGRQEAGGEREKSAFGGLPGHEGINASLRNYYGSAWQYASKDGSNSFHPSAAVVRSLMREASIPMALYMIEQAAAPCCATKGTGQGVETPEAEGCVPGDIGVLAAKDRCRNRTVV